MKILHNFYCLNYLFSLLFLAVYDDISLFISASLVDCFDFDCNKNRTIRPLF